MVNRYHNGPPSDHFNGHLFFNPHHPNTDRSLLQLLRWRLGGKRATWPATGDVTLTSAEATQPMQSISGGGDRDGFPFFHSSQAMKVGGESGAMRTGRNEMIAEGGEG
jgi:hypothetical protein